MKPFILIIEDDETLRVTVQNFLAKLGFEVRSAETGEAGLALAAQRGADLALVDLSGVEHKFPAQLSGGQQKRVGLARAIILRPALVLYDEPTTGLDPIRSDGISELILRLRDYTGITGIVVTHDLACMRKVADRVVMLFQGGILFNGTVDEIYGSADPHVQHFIAGIAEDDEAEAPEAANSPARARKRLFGGRKM